MLMGHQIVMHALKRESLIYKFTMGTISRFGALGMVIYDMVMVSIQIPTY